MSGSEIAGRYTRPSGRPVNGSFESISSSADPVASPTSVIRFFGGLYCDVVSQGTQCLGDLSVALTEG